MAQRMIFMEQLKKAALEVPKDGKDSTSQKQGGTQFYFYHYYQWFKFSSKT